MSRKGDRHDSPPVLGRIARAPGSAAASAGPSVALSPATPATPPAGTRVTADAAIAAALPWAGDLAADSPIRLYYLAAAALATG
ncbi:MAG TPA: molecular chaperone DnaJ, partial [Anaeromyxobacteraceae bacterium]|nr:molecular chaperone DnaJ [Anaeromyxobacteraceae bacterium]